MHLPKAIVSESPEAALVVAIIARAREDYLAYVLGAPLCYAKGENVRVNAGKDAKDFIFARLPAWIVEFGVESLFDSEKIALRVYQESRR